MTGIKPTGSPHLGNYFGAIVPALKMAAEYDQANFFIANYHGLNQIQNSEKLKELTLSIAATWLACGLDPNTTNIYAQSDIPEIFELETILTSFTPKGWMNKAHAYKAISDANTTENNPIDDGVSMGLYTYPILMAADILIFNTNVVPVGKDQIQHVEIARDIALKINSHYDSEILTLPDYKIAKSVETVIGIDGRKMSKSYDNVIPIIADYDSRQKIINKIVTDSSAPDEPKTAEGSSIYELYKLIASDSESDDFKNRLENGKLGWGDAKQELGQKMNDYFADTNSKYNQLMENPEEIQKILETGAQKVRPIAKATLNRVRDMIGII